MFMAFLPRPASSGFQEAETEIPVVQSLRMDDEEEEEEKNEEEQQQHKEEEDREEPSAAAPLPSPPQPDQSESSDAAGTTEVKPEPNKNLIELETAEEKNSKALEVTSSTQNKIKWSNI